MIHEQNDAGQSNQINTGGGALTSGTVSTGGGDFVGRDQTIFGDQVAGDKVGGDKVMGEERFKFSDRANERYRDINVGPDGAIYVGDIIGKRLQKFVRR